LTWKSGLILRAAGGPGLAHAPRDVADHRAALVEARVVDREIVGGLVAGAVLELDVRELLGDAHGRVHEAERGREHDVVAGGGELTDHALGVGPFADVLDEGGRDLIAERRLDVLAPDLVPVGPAVVADRADIDEAGLDLLLRAQPRAEADERGSGGRAAQKVPAGETGWHFVFSLRLSVPLRQWGETACQGKPEHSASPSRVRPR
jgi:hypothetical protein